MAEFGIDWPNQFVSLMLTGVTNTVGYLLVKNNLAHQTSLGTFSTLCFAILVGWKWVLDFKKKTNSILRKPGVWEAIIFLVSIAIFLHSIYLVWVSMKPHEEIEIGPYDTIFWITDVLGGLYCLMRSNRFEDALSDFADNCASKGRAFAVWCAAGYVRAPRAASAAPEEGGGYQLLPDHEDPALESTINIASLFQESADYQLLPDHEDPALESTINIAALFQESDEQSREGVDGEITVVLEDADE